MKFPTASRMIFTTATLLSPTWCLPAAWTADKAVSYEESEEQTTPAPPQPTGTTDHDWHLTLTPYLWFAGLSGTTAVFAHDASMHVSAGDLLSHFRIGLMADVAARKNRFVFPLDFLWIKLRADKATPFDPGISNVQLDINEVLLTPKAGYRAVDSQKIKVDALAGFRYWHHLSALGNSQQYLRVSQLRGRPGWRDN